MWAGQRPPAGDHAYSLVWVLTSGYFQKKIKDNYEELAAGLLEDGSPSFLSTTIEITCLIAVNRKC